MLYFWIGVGSGIGGVFRVALADWIIGLTGPQFPWGTIAANVLGSLVIGFLAALPGADGRPFAFAPAGQFLMVGVLGGFTTFSAFSLQTLGLMQQGAFGAAVMNVVVSVVAGVLAAVFGFAVAAALTRAGGI